MPGLNSFALSTQYVSNTSGQNSTRPVGVGQPKLFTGLPASSNAALNVEPVHASLPMRIQPVSKRRYVPQRSGSISLALIQPFS